MTSNKYLTAKLTAKPGVISLKFSVIIFLALLLITLNIVNPKIIKNFLINDALFKENTAYLVTSEERITQTIFLLSGIEGLYKTIESAEFGIDFLVKTQLIIGKEITALAEQASQARSHAEYLLAATVMLQLVSAITHDSTMLLLNTLIATLLVFFILSYKKYFWAFKLSKKLVYWVSILFISFHIVIPYSIHIAAAVSHTITNTYVNTHVNNLNNLHSQLTTTSQSTYNTAAQTTATEENQPHTASTTKYKEINFREKQTKSLLKKFEIIYLNFDEYLRHFYSNWYKHIMYEVLSVFVIPFALILVMILYFRSIYSKLSLGAAETQQITET